LAREEHIKNGGTVEFGKYLIDPDDRNNLVPGGDVKAATEDMLRRFH